MKLGYACINETLKKRFRTCRLKTFREEGVEKIKELTLLNLDTTLENIKWNIEHDILLYRLTSDLVPFATLPEMDWEWWEDEDVLRATDEIKNLQKKHELRLTIHPGQYTVLNSPNKAIVDRAKEDLSYHSRILQLVNGTDMILHTGGEYGDKEAAKNRFIAEYKTLDKTIKKTLRLENDDKTFTIKDVLEINDKCGVPICFDIHHHICNMAEMEPKEIVDKVIKTWGDTKPKMHISTGKTSEKDRSHHDYVSEEDFKRLRSWIKGYDVDIMFESKKKEISVLKIKEIFGL